MTPWPLSNRKSCLALSVFVVILATLQGCSRKKFDLGKLEGPVYTNQFFRMQFTIPAGWTAISKEDRKWIEESYKDKKAQFFEQQFALDHASAETQPKSNQTVELLTVAKSPLGTNPMNPSFQCRAMRLPADSEITNGERYLGFLWLTMRSKAFQEAFGPVKWIQGSHPVKIGDRQFFAMEAAIGAEGKESRMTFYVDVVQGYALVFVASYVNDEDRKAIDGLLQSVKFGK